MIASYSVGQGHFGRKKYRVHHRDMPWCNPMRLFWELCCFEAASRFGSHSLLGGGGGGGGQKEPPQCIPHPSSHNTINSMGCKAAPRNPQQNRMCCFTGAPE